MKKFIYFFLLTPFLLLSCKKDSGDNIDHRKDLPSYDVSVYGSTGIGDEFDMPQVTIKNEKLQITGLGRNFNGVPQQIEKLYLSDTESEAEWIVVIDDNRRPAFMYEINSATGKQEPHLYSFEKISEQVSYVRYYEYDWINRIGTLQYEVKFTNGQQEIVFERSADASVATANGGQRPVLHGSDSGNVAVSKGSQQYIGSKRVKTGSNRSFGAPVVAFDRLIDSRQRQAASDDDDDTDISKMVDKAIEDIIVTSKNAYDDALNMLCGINLISKFKATGCGITEAVKTATDRITVDELGDAYRQQQQQNPQQRSPYEAKESNVNFGFFPDVKNIIDAIGEHLNRIGDRWSEQQYDSLGDWINDLTESTIPDGKDLDDLPDSKGVLQIGLSWDTTSDIDLHVTDPLGEKISYFNPYSASGGYLDRDDVDGFGPENIYWSDNIPDGTYLVQVHYYTSNESGVPASSCIIKVSNGLGDWRQFEGTLTKEDEMAVVCRFTKSGNTIRFH